MCGIIGYISTTKEDVCKILTNNLKKLEYRGYDSSGICLKNNNGFYIQKSLGEIKNLEEKLLHNNIHSSCGIAHTRWATHGKVSLKNTHPHTSENNAWSIVHNGIIENHLNLRKQLEKHNIKLYGETDTEIIPNLMELETDENNLTKLKNVAKKLDGSYAFCLMNNSENCLYLARNKSPLFVAINSHCAMASSDPCCFSEFENYYIVPNKCLVKLYASKVEFFDFDLNPISVSSKKVGVFEKSANKGDYPYFAEKEINEIPYVLKNIISSYETTDYFKKITKNYLKNIKNIKLIGCGTAYHACLMGARYIEQNTQIEANAYVASEFRYLNPKLNKNSLCIFLSQSGETADTLLCEEMAKQKGAKTIAIVNVPYSSIAREADITLPLCAGMEIAVISTKAYNAMLFVLYLLSRHMQNMLNDKTNMPDLSPLVDVNFFYDFNKIEDICDKILQNEKIFFIGKGEDYVTALEAGLKLKEITYINCISLPSGELKHGTLSLVDDKSLVFVIATKTETLYKNLASASEIKSRGGKIVLVTNLDIKQSDLAQFDYVINFAKAPEIFSSILSVVPFQQIAYKTCIKLGNSPDKPRNLAKSVTVE